MSKEEYMQKSLEIAHVISEKAKLALKYDDTMREFVKFRDKFSSDLFIDVGRMLIDAHRHKVLEVITCLEEQERLVSENEPDPCKKIELLNQINEFKKPYENDYKTARKYMDIIFKEDKKAMS